MKNEWLVRISKLLRKKYGYSMELTTEPAQLANLTEADYPYYKSIQDNTLVIPILNTDKCPTAMVTIAGVKNQNKNEHHEIADWIQSIVGGLFESIHAESIANNKPLASIKNSNVVPLSRKRKFIKIKSPTDKPVSDKKIDAAIKPEKPIILHGKRKHLYKLALEIHDLTKNWAFLNLSTVDKDLIKLTTDPSSFENCTLYVPELAKLNMWQALQLNQIVRSAGPKPLIIVGTEFSATELASKHKLTERFLKKFIFCHFLDNSQEMDKTYRERIKKSALLALGQDKKSAYSVYSSLTDEYYYLPLSQDIIQKSEETIH